jgi:hypothetical protein
MLAQLRDVLAAKDSSVVAEKNEHRRLLGPQRTQRDFRAVGIGKDKVCELGAKEFAHDSSILSTDYDAVKHCATTVRRPQFRPL